MSDNIQTLRLLDDLPVGLEQDRFHHDLYAEMLRDVFESSKPGFCIGLFGKWGQGKSTVVRLLKEKLGGQGTVITFNAWKASGDSIRRQLLLHVLSVVTPKKAVELKRFVGVEIVESLLLTETERRKNRSQARLRTALDWILWLKVSWLLLVTIVLLSLGVVCAILSVANVSEQSSLFLQIALALFFPAGIFLASYVARTVRLRYSGHLSIGQPLSESQKLKYPEQFKELLAKYAGLYCKENGNLIIVVDDLDRCDADTIAEALAAIRQFTPDEISDSKDFRCQFLVPCDEMQVVLALETAGHDAGGSDARFHDYHSEELLRKFFDVTIRMHDILPEDLSEYAALLAESIGLAPQEGREMAGLVNPRDPRLVKKLINALCLSHARIEKGQRREIFPDPNDLPRWEQTERLLVALRETNPEMYRGVAANPSLLDTDDAKEQWKELHQKRPIIAAQAREMIEASGGVSAVSAQILIYGKLPAVLHHIPVAGKLIRSLRLNNHDEFSEVVSELDPADKPKVQQWLCREASSVTSATGLNRILSLFVDYPSSDAEADFIAPCVDAAIGCKSFLREALANYARFEQLEALLPRVEPKKEQAVYQAVFEDFTRSKGESDRELRFLLATCARMNTRNAEEFRQWLIVSLQGQENNSEIVARLFQCMPDDRSKCSGFAPEVAVLAANASEWTDDPDEELRDDAARWPRHNVIVTFVGDSEEHAVRCLNAILMENGQLATPQQITVSTPGIAPAWRTVEYLLSLVSDDDLQANFNHVQAWLNHQPQPEGLRLVLDALGTNALRLSSDQISQLARFIVSRLRAQPTETYLVDFVGEVPSRDELKRGWQSFVSEFTASYFQQLEGRPPLSPQEVSILNRIHQYKWSISEQAENLLVKKMRAANVSSFDPWLDVLVPLIGNRRVNLREAVTDSFERNHRVEQAFSAGLRVLWKKEVDAEAAAVIGRFFINNQSTIPNHRDKWNLLSEKKGAGEVLAVLQDNLPSEVENLLSYRNALEMVADGFDKLNARRKRTFVDKRLLPLVSLPDPSRRQMGLELSRRLPVVSADLKKQLKSLQKDGELGDQQAALVKEILKKPVV